MPSGVSSVTSTSVSTHLSARRRFDDRLQTAVATQLRLFGSERAPDLSFLTQIAQECNKLANVVLWSETPKIASVLDSQLFVTRFGTASVLSLSPSHILVGTSKGAVAAFDYGQNLGYVLTANFTSTSTALLDTLDAASSQAETVDTPITAISFSADGLFVSAGHMDGNVTVWDVSQMALASSKGLSSVVEPYTVIAAIPIQSQPSAKNGHRKDTPITAITFVDDLHLFLVSADVSGVVMYHHGFKKFLRKHMFSDIVAVGKKKKKATFLDCQMLPVGTSPQVTDLIGLTAFLDTNEVRIMSIRSLNHTSSTHLLPHFQMNRLRRADTDSTVPFFGCLAWYPCLQKDKALKSVVNAKLAVSWNNTVCIIELNNSGIPENILDTLADVKDKDKAIPILPMFKTGTWTTIMPKDRVVALKWLNSEILTAMVQSADTFEVRLHVLYYFSIELNADFRQVGLDNIQGQQISTLNLECTWSSFSARLFASSLQIFRHRPLVLVTTSHGSGKRILTGKMLKWADRLMQQLARKDFFAALLSAYDFYHSTDSGRLIVWGLPHMMTERHEVVKPILLNIMREAVKPLFADSSSLSVAYECLKQTPEDLLKLYVHIVALLTQDAGGIVEDDLLEILELICEVLSDDSLFFSVLEKFIIAQQIPSLSPTLLENLVEHLAITDKKYRITEMVCLLDSTSLNIDATLRLCERHNLLECSTYIWNKLLHDYATPFEALLRDLRTEDADADADSQGLVYKYLSYVLSGRQFPSDEYLSEADEERAREDICGPLFSYILPDGSELPVGPQSSSVFPYLTYLLMFNVAETLMALNEYFESPSLNSPQKFDRQYIIEALLDIFDLQSFQGQEKVYLAIFVARNYPKFIQFIRLSDSVLQTTLVRLCGNVDLELHEDCELALQSLIQVYDVGDETYFMEQLRAAHFDNVIFSMYRQTGDFSGAAEVYLRSSDRISFSVVAELLEATFRPQTLKKQKADVLKVLGTNFNKLVRSSASDLVILANTYYPQIHAIALSGSDETAFMYLKEVYTGAVQARETPPLLLGRYIRLLCLYQPDKVLESVLRHSASLKADTALIDTLRSAGHIDAVAQLLVLQGKHKSALEELLIGIRETDSRLEQYITGAIDICESSLTNLWTLLVTDLVLVSNKAQPLSRDTLHHGIYRSFRRLLDTHIDSTTLHHVLHEIMACALISAIRGTLHEVLTAYLTEIEMLNISLDNVNVGVRKHMRVVRADKLHGWAVKNKKCASCGLSMCGKDVPWRHYLAWEDRERMRLVVSDYADCELVFFGCGHGYHGRCLRGLSSWGECVLCL